MKGLQSHFADTVRQSPSKRVVEKTHNSHLLQGDLDLYYTRYDI